MCSLIHVPRYPNVYREEGTHASQYHAGTELPGHGLLLWLGPQSPPCITVPQHTLLERRACIWKGIAGPYMSCACVYAHMCVGPSAPSAVESLVYSNSLLGPKLPLCWPPKPGCLFQPFWPPIRELGKEGPLSHSWLRVSVSEHMCVCVHA